MKPDFQIKKFWEKEIIPLLPEDEEWKDLSKDEKKRIAKMIFAIIAKSEEDKLRNQKVIEG